MRQFREGAHVPKYQYTVIRGYIRHKFGGRMYFACFADEMDPSFRVCAEILKHFEKKLLKMLILHDFKFGRSIYFRYFEIPHWNS